MTGKSGCIGIIGVLLILMGLASSEWVLASFTSDGQIDSSGQLLMIRLVSTVSILIGIAILVFRRSSIVPKLMASAGIMVVMLIIMDGLLYFAVPLLPSSLVLGMSPNAQVRYFHAHENELPWVYAQNVRYMKPNSEMMLFNRINKADSLGYRNPQGYLEEQEDIDVLLLGDSFVWGTEEQTIADYLREDASINSYSLGMAGSGIPQWRYHFERYLSELDEHSTPKVAVLNFYSGNDITDTNVFLALQERKGVVDSADYYTYINYQFLLPTANRSYSLPKLPEFVFLTNSTLYRLRPTPSSRDEAPLLIGDEPAPSCLAHREPAPELLDEKILAQIEMVVNQINTLSPKTQVVLSYIPTSSGIYGDMMSACSQLVDDLGRQEEISARLAEHSAELNIHYVDFTPLLREYAHDNVVWSEIDHFSPVGYEIYAQLLAREIEPYVANEETAMSFYEQHGVRVTGNTN